MHVVLKTVHVCCVKDCTCMLWHIWTGISVQFWWGQGQWDLVTLLLRPWWFLDVIHNRSLHSVSKAAAQSQGGKSFALRCFVFTPQAIIKLCVDKAVTC